MPLRGPRLELTLCCCVATMQRAPRGARGTGVSHRENCSPFHQHLGAARGGVQRVASSAHAWHTDGGVLLRGAPAAPPSPPPCGCRGCDSVCPSASACLSVALPARCVVISGRRRCGPRPCPPGLVRRPALLHPPKDAVTPRRPRSPGAGAWVASERACVRGPGQRGPSLGTQAFDWTPLPEPVLSPETRPWRPPAVCGRRGCSPCGRTWGEGREHVVTSEP